MRSKTQTTKLLPFVSILILMPLAQTVSSMPILRRLITVEDSVRTRRFVDGEVKLSPEGTQIAYIVKSPDIEQNRNVFQLYRVDLRKERRMVSSKLLLEAAKIYHLHWLGEYRLTFCYTPLRKTPGDRRVSIAVLNVESGALRTLQTAHEILDYSVSTDGETLVFSTPSSKPLHAPIPNPKAPTSPAIGITIGEGTPDSQQSPEDEVRLYRVRGFTDSSQPKVSALLLTDPITKQRTYSLPLVSRLALSPNGHSLLFRYRSTTLPTGWTDRPLIEQLRSFGTPGFAMVLQMLNLDTGDARMGFNFPAGYLEWAWAGDSQSYAVVGPSPFDSPQAKLEETSGVSSGNIFFHAYRYNHLFTITASAGQVTSVLDRNSGEDGSPTFSKDVPLAWDKSDGPLLTRTGANEFGLFEISNGKWNLSDKAEPVPNQLFGSSFTASRRFIAGVAQSASYPPNLFLYDVQTRTTHFVTDLNPSLNEIQLGNVERFEWTNRYGSKCSGHLIKPPNFTGGRLYPFVFLAADESERFLSDVEGGTTGYPPQALADAGFLVLVSHYPHENRIPEGKYPGRMKDAFNWMAMVEGAVDALVKQEIADPEKVGLAGFSRTSWLTDFTITHSAYKFAAVSSSDSGTYTYSSYFSNNSKSTMEDTEAQFGGPPYGSTLSNWLQFAAPFNAQNVNGAVLMEYTGDIRDAYEFYVTLRRNCKPAELIWYPRGSHPLDTPRERVESLQRNLDWFRFWIQGYERAGNEEQYEHWHTLKTCQQ